MSGMQDAQVTKSLLNTFGEGFIIASIFCLQVGGPITGGEGGH